MPSENSMIAVHGREKRRGCTDVVFLAGLLAALGYMFFVTHHSRVNGNLDKIVYGQDYKAGGQDKNGRAQRLSYGAIIMAAFGPLGSGDRRCGSDVGGVWAAQQGRARHESACVACSMPNRCF